MTKKSRRVAKVRRVLFTLSLVLVMMVVAVGGTMAWLTDSTTNVTNTFTPTNIDIDLAETKGTSFEIIPGKTHEKDPKVTVAAGSEKSWVFVKVIENSASYITGTTADPVTNYVALTHYISYSMADGWTLLSEDTDKDTLTTTKVYYRIVDESTTAQPFDVIAENTVTIKDTVTKADMDKLYTTGAVNPTLDFTAYAIQYEGFAPVATEDTTDNEELTAATKAWNEVNK